jgi:sporulation protein YabP
MALEQIKEKTRGEITLSCRSEMKISGVEAVESFDEESVRLMSVDGALVVEGSGIKIGTLDTERGVVSLTGRINAIYYANDPEKQKKGFWGKVMR